MLKEGGSSDEYPQVPFSNFFHHSSIRSYSKLRSNPFPPCRQSNSRTMSNHFSGKKGLGGRMRKSKEAASSPAVMPNGAIRIRASRSDATRAIRTEIRHDRRLSASSVQTRCPPGIGLITPETTTLVHAESVALRGTYHGHIKRWSTSGNIVRI
jgi:hypothetical protein